MYNFSSARRQLPLSLRMVADGLDDLFWDFTLHSEDQARFYGFRVFLPGEAVEPGILYLLPEDCGPFPEDRQPYISIGERPGGAEHICVRGRTLLETANQVERIFQRFRDFEAQLNWIVQHGGGLDDLCAAAIRYLQNPVYIHDSVFTILAQPCHVEGMLELERDPETGRQFIPLWLVEDFKFSQGYRDTLHRRKAAIWGTNQYPYHMRSLYVNIWDMSYYRARLLVNELHAPLRPGDWLVVEYLADYVLMILRRDDRNAGRSSQDLAGALQRLISTGESERRDLRILLATLGWREDGQFLLVKLQSQGAENAVTSSSVLRGSLSAAFPGTFLFFYERQLCMVLDIDASGQDRAAFRSKLAPFLRDSLMYAGMSLPVESVFHLDTAYIQAGAALDHAFRLRGHRWCVAFEDCALEYLTARIRTPTPLPLYLSPVPRFLRQYDREHGSQYSATLKCYLLHERSIPRTAEALIIHRTTLLYRLEKIAALTKLDLDSETVRLYLLLSFRLEEDT